MGDKNTFNIMIIDDNQSIHHDFIKILNPQSSPELDKLRTELFGESPAISAIPQFKIDVALQGKEGVARVKQALEKGIHYALVFVDIRMPPGWDGIETIKHIWALDEAVHVVICTAYSDYSWDETVLNLGKTDKLLILKKPFDNMAVRQLACALTTKWQLAFEAQKSFQKLQQQVADKTSALNESRSLVKSTFLSSNEGILIINNEGGIIDYNQNLINLLKIPQSILDANSHAKFFEYINKEAENGNEFAQKMAELQHNADAMSTDVIRFKNGKTFEWYSQPHKRNNKIIGRILDFHDITQRVQVEQELQYQATHDSLTGLFNRIKLLQAMKWAIKNSEQNHMPFAVVFIDLDRFKLVNDSLSHEVGDKVLINAAQRLQSALRVEDTVARLGGDEFVIVFMNTMKKEHIEKLARKVIKLFQRPFDICNRQLTITASMGISRYPKDGKTVETLLRNADAAMYRAKSHKGNGFQFYNSEMCARSLVELDQETELRQALAKGEFFLCYQPEIDLMDEKLVAVEALIRWRHPQKGILLPSEFIPLTEDMGLIVSIGEWVMRTACAQNKAWQDKGLPPIRVAVNVAQQQLEQKELAKLVKKTLKETGLQAKHLEIEITENVILGHSEIVRTLSQFKKIGVMVTIDDFGTGYSSLSYLRNLPLDRLKIASSFIQHIHGPIADDEVIIRAIIDMAKKLKLQVIAEGVENSEQMNFLKKNHCGDVQGFYFSKPLEENEVETYLSDQTKIKNIMEK